MTGPSLAQVADFWTLREAARRAARGTGKTRGTTAFLAELESGVLALQRELLAGTYAPRPLHRFRIRDPKPRWIAAAHFRDRVVHHALCAVLEPVFAHRADPDSYACRVGKGTHAAIRRIQAHVRRFSHFTKLDILHCFENFDLNGLHRDLAGDVRDAALVELIGVILEAGADAPGRGLPIGNLTSQHLANHRLGVLDRAARELGVRGYVRYMDDLFLFGDESGLLRAQAAGLVRVVEDELCQREKLSARRAGPVHAGVPALGFRVWPQCVRLDGARRRRFLRRMRHLDRSVGHGLVDESEAAVRAQSIVAWASHADTLGLRRSLHDPPRET